MFGMTTGIHKDTKYNFCIKGEVQRSTTAMRYTIKYANGTFWCGCEIQWFCPWCWCICLTTFFWSSIVITMIWHHTTKQHKTLFMSNKPRINKLPLRCGETQKQKRKYSYHSLSTSSTQWFRPVLLARSVSVRHVGVLAQYKCL